MRPTQKWRQWAATGAGVGLCLSGFLVFLSLLRPEIAIPLPEPTPDKEEIARQQEQEIAPEQDSLQKGVQVEIARVELPDPPVAGNAEQKKAPAPLQAAKNAKGEQVKPAVVQPTTRLLAKGEVLLENADQKKVLPQVLGDFGRLGFKRYFEAILQSGGKLVVYDWTGNYGNLPLVELGENGEISMPQVANHDVDRPRFLGTPYDGRIAVALEKLNGREYLNGDLRPAFVLPRQAEYFILGAIEKVLHAELYEYETLSGEYRQNLHGKLVFTIMNGQKRGQNGEVVLSRPIEINFGLIT